MSDLGEHRPIAWHRRLAGGMAPLLTPLLSPLAEFVFPVVCEHCGAAGVEAAGVGGGAGRVDYPLCAACEGAVLRAAVEPACGDCGRYIGQAGDGCQHCLGKGYPHIGRVVRWTPYVPAVRSLVLKVKFGRRWPIGEYLGRCLAGKGEVAEAVGRAELVVPVPLHGRRLFGRGFNAPEVVARALCGALGAREKVRGGGGWLRRVRATEVQSRQGSKAARARNVAGAFVGGAGVKGKRVLLVDDVLTTGATVTEAARALKAAGAAGVELLVVAVAGEDRERWEE